MRCSLREIQMTDVVTKAKTVKASPTEMVVWAPSCATKNVTEVGTETKRADGEDMAGVG